MAGLLLFGCLWVANCLLPQEKSFPLVCELRPTGFRFNNISGDKMSNELDDLVTVQELKVQLDRLNALDQQLLEDSISSASESKSTEDDWGTLPSLSLGSDSSSGGTRGISRRFGSLSVARRYLCNASRQNYLIPHLRNTPRRFCHDKTTLLCFHHCRARRQEIQKIVSQTASTGTLYV